MMRAVKLPNILGGNKQQQGDRLDAAQCDDGMQQLRENGRDLAVAIPLGYNSYFFQQQC